MKQGLCSVWPCQPPLPAWTCACAGGTVHIMNGNHEIMNASGRFRYATPGGFEGFARWRALRAVEGALKVCPCKTRCLLPAPLGLCVFYCPALGFCCLPPPRRCPAKPAI